MLRKAKQCVWGREGGGVGGGGLQRRLLSTVLQFHHSHSCFLLCHCSAGFDWQTHMHDLFIMTHLYAQTIDHICHWESLQNARKYYSLVTLVPIIPKGSSLLETCSTCQTKQKTKRPTDLKMNLEKHIHEWRLAESEHSLECLGRPDVPRGLMVPLCVILIWLFVCVILAYWGGGGVQTEKFSKFLGF